VKFYEPTGTGESPLAAITKWVNVKCPKCGGKGKRETNTMPQWAGSSWYYLRYIDPKNKKALVDKKKEKYWSPVDLYVGGGEHNTRHLIYARFWHKFLFDIGVVSNQEPFMKLRSLGMILGSDGRKMSKRWGNVVNPDDVVKNVGADTLRVYEMFMGPFDQEIAWSTDNMVGSRRFLDKVWKLQDKISSHLPPLDKGGLREVDKENFEILLNKTVKKVTDDILNFNFNTAISAFMILINLAEKSELTKADYEIILKLLAPFAPHITEEIWANIGNKKSIHLEKWPEFDESKIASEEITVVVQIDGKPRANFKAPAGVDQKKVEEIALALPEVRKWTDGKTIKSKMFVKGKILIINTL
jgi:leucyl-tRNA synthetase